MYPHGLDASAWVAFFESETREIDILHRHDPGSNAPDIAKLVETFPAKARTRLMATRATTATLAPKPEQRFRSFSKDFSHDLYRADSELLIRQHSFGQADSPGPIVHVVDMGRPDGLFATYIEHSKQRGEPDIGRRIGWIDATAATTTPDRKPPRASGRPTGPIEQITSGSETCQRLWAGCSS